MIKKYTKISLLWVSMVCGNLFGAENASIERHSLSQMFQEHIKNYAFIPHSKREVGFFAAGTVGMGYLWALRSENVPGYVKCILVAPPAVLASHVVFSKLGVLGSKASRNYSIATEPTVVKKDVRNTPAIPTVSSLSKGTPQNVNTETLHEDNGGSAPSARRQPATPREAERAQIANGLEERLSGYRDAGNEAIGNIQESVDDIQKGLQELKNVVQPQPKKTGTSWWPFAFGRNN